MGGFRAGIAVCFKFSKRCQMPAPIFATTILGARFSGPKLWETLMRPADSRCSALIGKYFRQLMPLQYGILRYYQQ